MLMPSALFASVTPSITIAAAGAGKINLHNAILKFILERLRGFRSHRATLLDL
jgi:hypothetical protein